MIFHGTPVWNEHPRHMRRGGRVQRAKGMTRRQLTHDSVLAVLQPGEIVIPKTYKGRPLVGRVERALIRSNIWLPHFKK